MELKRDEIIKALEYCTGGGSCNKCPYDDKPRLSFEGCLSSKMRDALALIKELTEENQRLIQEGFEITDYAIDEIRVTRADAQNKMPEDK